MSEEFDRDLEAVFEERAGDFSSELRQLLRELWKQGVLAGRARERGDHLEMQGASRLHVPDVLEGARAGAERFARKAGQRAREGRCQPGAWMQELLSELDAAILEKLASQSRAHFLAPLPGNVLVQVATWQAPARRPANLNDWRLHVEGVEGLGMGPDSTAWTRQLMAALPPAGGFVKK